MDYAIAHPRFLQRKLTLRTSIVGGVTLLIDGERAVGKKNVYMLSDDAGDESEVKLTPNLFGTSKVSIDGSSPLDVMPPLPWYAYLFAALPFALMITGGAIGGGLGAFAGIITLGLFRSDSPMGLKIAGSIGITLFSGGLFLFFATVIHVLMGTV